MLRTYPKHKDRLIKALTLFTILKNENNSYLGMKKNQQFSTPKLTYLQRHTDEIISVPVPNGVSFGKYNALVIGINKYPYLTNLKTAVSDATTVAEVLKTDYQFSNVKLLLDPTRNAIISALAEMRSQISHNDNLLIYYAGHGLLDNDADEGYWLASDATKNDETNWVSNAFITSTMRAIKAKHIMIVADSCYSGKLTRSLSIKRKGTNYYSKISKKKARVVISSGGLEPVADQDRNSKHSPFAKAFIKALKENTGLIDGTALFLKIRRPVMLATDQTPSYADIRKAGHDGGDFIFVRPVP